MNYYIWPCEWNFQWAHLKATSPSLFSKLCVTKPETKIECVRVNCLSTSYNFIHANVQIKLIEHIFWWNRLRFRFSAMWNESFTHPHERFSPGSRGIYTAREYDCSTDYDLLAGVRTKHDSRPPCWSMLKRKNDVTSKSKYDVTLKS